MKKIKQLWKNIKYILNNDIKRLDSYTIFNIENLWKKISELRKIMCEGGLHYYSTGSAFACGNVEQISQLERENIYNLDRCWYCNVEKPDSRNYFNRI